MPVIFQTLIYRSDLIANPEVLYLFGDNAQRQGLGGQAKEMRGEGNAIGVRTKHHPSNRPGSYFGDEDEDFALQAQMINEDMKPVADHLRAGGLVVIPLEGLGTGLAKLTDHAPRTAAFINEFVLHLKGIQPDG